MLLAIQEASGEAMRELRATLEVLRDDAADEPQGSGLDQLDDLVDRTSSAGLPVTITISGNRQALPVSVDSAADPDLSDVRVVILTNYGLDEYVFDALRAGATGFLVKDTEPADLLYGIRVAAHGDALLAPAITRRLIGEFVAAAPGHPPPDSTRSPIVSAR